MAMLGYLYGFVSPVNLSSCFAQPPVTRVASTGPCWTLGPVRCRALL